MSPCGACLTHNCSMFPDSHTYWRATAGCLVFSLRCLPARRSQELQSFVSVRSLRSSPVFLSEVSPLSSAYSTRRLTFEFLALIVLRIRRPGAHRSFRVPGGWWGMAYVCLTPFAFTALVLFATLRDWRSFPGQLLVVAGVALSGVTLYFMRRRIAVPRISERFKLPTTIRN